MSERTRLLPVFIVALALPALGAEPAVVGHRGLLRHAPENTLANVRACLALRLGFEVDVRRSEDGRLVCVHDVTVDRTTDGRGKVADLTFAQLETLDAGRWFDARFTGAKVPAFADVLALLAASRSKDVLVAVDLKARGIEANCVRLAKEAGVLERLLFIGNAIDNAEVRGRLRKADKAAHVACVANEAREFPPALAAKNADWVYFRYVPSRAEMKSVHAAGKRAFIAGATVAGRKEANWRACREAGIDAILTDYPLVLAAQLRGAAGARTTKKEGGMDANFERIGARYVKQVPGFSPVGATSLGDHRFDDRLDEISGAARAGELAFYRAIQTELKAIDRGKLSRQNQVDYALLSRQLQKDIWQLEKLQEWQWNPLVFTRLAGGAVYGLMARDFAPLEARLEHVTARLEQFPRFYEQVRETLEAKRTPRVHAETAAKQNRGVLSILDNMVRPHVKTLPDEKRRRLEKALVTASEAVEAQQTWIEDELVPNAGGDFRLGPQLYDEKLAFTLSTGLTRQEIRVRAESELRRVRRDMYAIARDVVRKKKPDADAPAEPTPEQQQRVIEAALDLAYADIPARDQVVASARKSLELTTAFIRKRDLITIPEDPLEIIIMPEFQRGVSVAYCDAPGPLAVGEKTFYAVAPLPESWSDEQVKSFLREYNIRSIHNLTVHEAMPGHFVQLAHANRFPGKLRALLASGVFIEGWACYTEQMLSEEGFLDRDPLMRLITLKWYLRSITNALIDQRIHVDGMRRAEAMELMTRDGFQQEREAAGKWTRAQLTSAQLSTYFVGYQEHRDMRRAAEKAWGKEFTLKRYHDGAVSFGSPPVRFARALLLEEAIPE